MFRSHHLQGVFTLDFSSEPSQQPYKLVSLLLLVYSLSTKSLRVGAEAGLTSRALTKGLGSQGCQGTQILVAFFPRVGVSGRAEE